MSGPLSFRHYLLRQLFFQTTSFKVSLYEFGVHTAGFMILGREFLYQFCCGIDNNIAERAVKPFVIGRKNWLFSTSVKGAQASAMAYSIINTADANELNIREYLTSVFSHPGELILPFKYE